MKLPFLLLPAACLLVAARAADTPQPASPFSSLPQTPPVEDGNKTVVRPQQESIMDRSDLLSDGIHWTLVPKGAVLHIPASHASRVGTRPVGTLLNWHEFLSVNRSWLFTEEVTMDQAAGKTPLLPGRADAWQKLGKVVVAVHLTGPITVKPAASNTTASTR